MSKKESVCAVVLIVAIFFGLAIMKMVPRKEPEIKVIQKQEKKEDNRIYEGIGIIPGTDTGGESE